MLWNAKSCLDQALALKREGCDSHIDTEREYYMFMHCENVNNTYSYHKESLF